MAIFMITERIRVWGYRINIASYVSVHQVFILYAISIKFREK
jgi:hypothetical protein